VAVRATDGDRDWIVHQLTRLIARAGRERFLRAPIVEPTDEFFPDRWSPDVAGVRAIALRLLTHAGLSLGAELELFDHDDERVDAGRHGVTTAWYAGRANGRCRFGVAVDRLDDPATVVMVLAHEVAHAFRDFHHLEVDDRDVEEQLTDLTAVYLGFGILVANGASRYRTATVDGGTASTWTDLRMGYLPAPMLACALAVQARTRALTPPQIRRLATLLDTDQRASFRAALDVLETAPLRAALLRDHPDDVLARVSAEVDAILRPRPSRPRRRRAGLMIAAAVVVAVAVGAAVAAMSW
jgi:hypothetical protein